eukprot:6186968-Pleurochrysis_carterae.AAC.6
MLQLTRRNYLEIPTPSRPSASQPWLREDHSFEQSLLPSSHDPRSQKIRYCRKCIVCPTSLTLPSEASDHYVISLELLANVDRQLMKKILKTVESVATRPKLRNNCNSSGRELIRIICRIADNVPASTGMAIESMMQAQFDSGLEKRSLHTFNIFYHIYDRFNRSLPAHQRLSEGAMAEKLCYVIRGIREDVGTLLDVKTALTSATGLVAPTLTAIRDVPTELDEREHYSIVAASKPGRAFLAN